MDFIMPAPFAWIEIPDKGYSIAKYPITNAQYAKFIEAGGYDERRWWTDAGWEAKLKGWEWNRKTNKCVETNQPWTQPQYWTDTKWNGAEQPVIGVSWYECVAFCQWLSEMTGETITLVTEEQRQHAAQGDDGRAFPWGNEWDGSRCNSSVNPYDSNGTTPVRQYEGKGDSPFGVVDLSGNASEWCLTDYEQKTNDPTSAAQHRVLRGGSWADDVQHYFECKMRMGEQPEGRSYDVGFRVARV